MDDRSKWDTVLGKVLGTVAIVVAGTFAGGAITARYATPLLEAIQSLKGGETVVSVMSKVGPWTDEAEGVLKGGSEAAEAVTETAEAAGEAAETIGETCNSFEPSTTVLMANGDSKPIWKVRVGDKVVATDVETGTTAAQAVTALIRHGGHQQIVDVRVTTSNGAEQIASTDHHPFYITNGNGRWVNAGELKAGDTLRAPDGTTRTVTRVSFRTETETVYNLTVDVAHTYYVGQTEPVLVHNSPCSPTDGDAPDGGGAKPALRQAYEADVRAIADETARLAEAGADPETIARSAWKMRRDLGIKYKDLTPPDELAKIYVRNIEKYGDRLGPTIEWLRKEGKTWEEIAESSARPGGKDLGF